MNFKSVQTAIETTLIFITLFLIAILSYVLANAVLDYFDNRVNSVSIEQQAIERGYALHCPKNGEFSISWFHFRVMCDVLKCPIIAKLPR